jgi:hypothetical protein
MFRFPDLKLYRKLLILGILSVSLFVLSANSRVAASACCDACLATYDSCINYCYGLNNDPDMSECLVACGTSYEACSRACGHGIPACIAV